MNNPLVSIVIPVKNGAYWLDQLFIKLAEQTLASRAEIICIDSGSTDDSQGIIQKHGAKLISILPTEFNHGATRNLGVEHALGEYIIMTVQDALPADNQWIEKLLAGFTDETVAGVCGQQIVPHDKDKNPVQWFRPVSQPTMKKVSLQSKDVKDLDEVDKRNITAWDNVSAAYRKDILLKIPFRRLDFAEDSSWAMDALTGGYFVVYNSHARVCHYHNEDYSFTFRRHLVSFYHRYKLLDIVPPKPNWSLRRKLSVVKTLLYSNISYAEKIGWWMYNRQFQLAAAKAYAIFMDALQKGENELDQMYATHCKVIPMSQYKINQLFK